MKVFYRKESLLSIGIALSIFWGVLSYQHYMPSQHDFYIHCFVFLFCSLGLGVFFLKKNVKVYTHHLFWVILLIVFMIQPIINHLIYTDGLVFPIAIIFLMFFLSLAISNLNDKNKFVQNISFSLIFISLLLILTQMIHIFNMDYFVHIMRLPLQTSRFSGNLFQPNQTAFVLVLGVVSVMYYFYNKPTTQYLKYLFIFLFSIGIAFTLSRTGVLMLILGVLSFNILKNKFEKVFVWRVWDFFYAMAGLSVGFIAYPYFSTAITMTERIASGMDEPRLSLLHRVGLIITEHPFLGVGWKNFATTGIQYFESIDWFDSTDHAHFVFGQLLSEFGLLGLGLIGVFLFIFIKNIKNIKNIMHIYGLIVVSVILFYSMFEFPLWQLRYLIIFAIFFALYDQFSKPIYDFKNKYLISCVIFLMSIFSIYYSYQYQKISYVYDFVTNDSNNLQEKKNKISDLPLVFGFGFFNDILVYEIISKQSADLTKNIEVGDRLVRYIPSYYYLIQHATALGAVGNVNNSIYYFNASCHFSYGKYCKDTLEYLKSLSEYDAEKFSEIYQEVSNKYNKRLQ